MSSEPLAPDHTVRHERDHYHAHDGIADPLNSSNAESDADYDQDEYDHDHDSQKIPLLEYLTFVLVGASFLWPWNCYMAATAYFTTKFTGHAWLQQNFLSSVMVTATTTGLVMSLILANKQKNVNYSTRLLRGEIIIAVQFVLMAVLCAFDIAPVPYFVLILITLLIAAVAASLTQNGSLAVCNVLTPKHMVANTVGQALSGVVAPIASLISSSATKLTSALYFATGSVICIGTYLFYRVVMRHHLGSSVKSKSVDAQGEYDEIVGSSLPSDPAPPSCANSGPEFPPTHTQRIPLRVLLSKLRIPAMSVLVTFCITLMYPIFANAVVSTSGINSTVFVPLVHLFWNVGDLTGRFACNSRLVLLTNPRVLVVYSWLRVAFLPLFLLCNINNNDGAFIRSDIVYLFIQYLFGFSNGQILTSSMVSVPSYVEEDEKEPAGGLMMLVLSIGLALGALLSFGLAWFLAGY